MRQRDLQEKSTIIIIVMIIKEEEIGKSLVKIMFMEIRQAAIGHDTSTHCDTEAKARSLCIVRQ